MEGMAEGGELRGDEGLSVVWGAVFAFLSFNKIPIQGCFFFYRDLTVYLFKSNGWCRRRSWGPILFTLIHWRTQQERAHKGHHLPKMVKVSQ